MHVYDQIVGIELLKQSKLTIIILRTKTINCRIKNGKGICTAKLDNCGIGNKKLVNKIQKLIWSHDYKRNDPRKVRNSSNPNSRVPQ